MSSGLGAVVCVKVAHVISPLMPLGEVDLRGLMVHDDDLETSLVSHNLTVQSSLAERRREAGREDEEEGTDKLFTLDL